MKYLSIFLYGSTGVEDMTQQKLVYFGSQQIAVLCMEICADVIRKRMHSLQSKAPRTTKIVHATIHSTTGYEALGKATVNATLPAVLHPRKSYQ